MLGASCLCHRAEGHEDLHDADTLVSLISVKTMQQHFGMQKKDDGPAKGLSAGTIKPNARSKLWDLLVTYDQYR